VSKEFLFLKGERKMAENKYKDTLNMGQTDFEMRAGLKDKEPAIEKAWIENDIYNKKIKLNEGKPQFVLHDGPPYANGNIHVGHALNKTLKDFIVRFKNSNGFQSPFIMGWDTHGLPIETAVAKSGVDRKATPKAEFRDICKKYALDQVENQANQFKRLGIFTDYDKRYITLDHKFEMTQLKLFLRMVEQNLVYRDLKPIYWSPTSESALAEAEIEYQDVKSPSIFVACELPEFEMKNTFVVIWTTTPWTIPSNQLIAVGEDIEYSIVKPENEERQFIIATDLIKTVAETIGWEKYEVIKIVKGTSLVGQTYIHPWFENKKSKVVLGHHVTTEAGTGMVHIAGGFGEDDFKIVKDNGMDAFVPIDDQGKFDIRIDDKRLEGLFYEDANKIVGQTLSEKGLLLKLKFVSHSYPHDWRTKKPIIYRATSQWFVSLEPVKDQIRTAIDEHVTTKPDWSKERLKNIILDRKDWTISRQRLWGVPILAFYDERKNPILDLNILKHAFSILEKEGTNVWFEKDADYFLPEEFKNKNWTKEKDILDVWFDSGSSNLNLEENFDLARPYDVYLEGNDQYRGWFNSSMINSIVFDGKPAYKHLITHGMTNDEKGRKMSKSIGNTVDPLQIAGDLGSDILRLWVATSDYTDDQRIGTEILKQVSEGYRKIRNTMRFILSNISDFDATKDYQTELNDVDTFALDKLAKTKQLVIDAYNNYSFNVVYKTVINYVINDLSSFYLDFIKDILYIEKSNGTRRRQVQTVLYEMIWGLIDMLRPIIPHTIEEVYTFMNEENKSKSVHLLDMREQNFSASKEISDKYNLVLKLRNDVNEAIEQARNNKVLKKSFEAVVTINLSKEAEILKDISDLTQLLIVNSIVLSDETQEYAGSISSISVALKEGKKCERCWAIYDELVNDEICQKCFDVIN
jgi:isoleucyl-tRNA synthetase